MSLTNSQDSYGSIAKFFHWTVSLFVIIMIILGFLMTNSNPPSLKIILYGTHKSLGLTILFLMVLRVLWRLVNHPPALPSDMPAWQARLASFSHFLIYFMLFVIPISGWVMSTASGYAPNFWWLIVMPAPWTHVNETVSSIAFGVHSYGAWVLVGLLALHILTALEHWIIRRDNVFQRMAPGCSKND